MNYPAAVAAVPPGVANGSQNGAAWNDSVSNPHGSNSSSNPNGYNGWAMVAAAAAVNASSQNNSSLSPNHEMLNPNHASFYDNNAAVTSTAASFLCPPYMKNIFGAAWDPSSFPSYPGFSPASTSQFSSTVSEQDRTRLSNQQLYPWMKMNGSKGGDSKRTRQTYTKVQTLELEKEFCTNHYLTRKQRMQVSEHLHLTERQVKIWFQNRRMKHKKEGKPSEIGGKESTGDDSGSDEIN